LGLFTFLQHQHGAIHIFLEKLIITDQHIFLMQTEMHFGLMGQIQGIIPFGHGNGQLILYLGSLNGNKLTLYSNLLPILDMTDAHVLKFAQHVIFTELLFLMSV
jgi:hypothetical protein